MQLINRRKNIIVTCTTVICTFRKLISQLRCQSEYDYDKTILLNLAELANIFAVKRLKENFIRNFALRWMIP